MLLQAGARAPADRRAAVAIISAAQTDGIESMRAQKRAVPRERVHVQAVGSVVQPPFSTKPIDALEPEGLAVPQQTAIGRSSQVETREA